MKKIINIVYLALICFPVKGFCESDENLRFISIGIGAGGFFADRYVANYYNGREENLNKISYVLGNSYWREEIRQQLPFGANYQLYELPSKMRYKVATAVNFRIAANLSSHSQIFLQINQVNLVATDIFTLELDMPHPQGLKEPVLFMCDIWGKEARSMIDVGFQRRYDMEAHGLQWFYELAFNVTNTRVKENQIEIGNFKHSIMSGQGAYIPGQPLYDPNLQNAIGIGIVGGLGFRYTFHPQASFDFGFTSYLQDINLEGYKNFTKNFNLYIRLNLLTF